MSLIHIVNVAECSVKFNSDFTGVIIQDEVSHNILQEVQVTRHAFSKVTRKCVMANVKKCDDVKDLLVSTPNYDAHHRK